MIRGFAALAVAALAVAPAIPTSAKAESESSSRYMRGAYFSVFASAANPNINNVQNQSTGAFAGASLTTTDSSDGVAFAPSFAIGYNLRQVGFPMRIETEYTIRGKAEYRETPLFVGRAGSDLNSVVENQAFMANMFLDFDREFWGFKPFVGWGLGVSWTDADYFRFTPAIGSSQAGSDRTTSFAWSVMAGAGVPFGRSWSFDLRYRYADLGEIVWGPQSNGANTVLLEAEDLTTHEFGIGLRYTF